MFRRHNQVGSLEIVQVDSHFNDHQNNPRGSHLSSRAFVREECHHHSLLLILPSILPRNHQRNQLSNQLYKLLKSLLLSLLNNLFFDLQDFRLGFLRLNHLDRQ